MPKVQLQGSKNKKQRKKGQSYKGIIELIRPFNCLLASLATIAGFNLVSLPNINALWAALTVFFVTAGGNAVNDFFDVKRDRINKPKRPIPSGKITAGTAVVVSIISFSLGLIFSYLVGLELFYLAIAASTTLILYSGIMKEYKLIGNIIISLLVGFTFISGSLAAGYWGGGISLAALAFVVNWSREIFKDMEERVPEKLTLVSFLGKPASSLTATGMVFWGILAAVSIGVGLSLFKRFVFLLAITSWVATIISYKDPERAQKFIKLGMTLIIISLLIPY
jgi:geranylgeranylglycerol-phosphate geranylgeranyltransferase